MAQNPEQAENHAAAASLRRLAFSMSGVVRITGARIPSFTGAASHLTAENRRKYQGRGRRFSPLITSIGIIV